MEEDEGDVEDDYSVELDSDSDVGSEKEESNSKQDNSSLKESTISKTVVAPHKKRKVVRSQLQGFSHIAKGIENMASAQIKKEDDAGSG